MKRIKGKWYITVFAAVMGFVAGTATELSAGYINVALESMGQVEGIKLLGIALTGMLFNGALFSWSSIAPGRTGRIMSFGALWIKAILMGLFCRELAMEFTLIKALLMLLTIAGGGCICVSFVLDCEDSTDKAKRLAVWLCGAAVEGIIIPSVARTYALLFK